MTTGIEAIKAASSEDISSSSKEEKVFQLNIELYDAKQRKKSSMKSYNEEIKRIQGEINELLTDDVETEATND
jgi:predicted  nucleic acid-binding Zn-ribbon protein